MAQADGADGGAAFDLVITNARVVRPELDRTDAGVDIGVRDGVVAALGPGLAASAVGTSTEVVDAGGLLAFPGSVDAHTHMGHLPTAGRRTR